MRLDQLYERLFIWKKENLTCIKDKDDNIQQITWQYDNLMYSITAPHDEYKDYMLRINPKETFDRWHNADIEVYYCTLEDLCFDIFEGSLTWIYRRLAQKYIAKYADLCK